MESNNRAAIEVEYKSKKQRLFPEELLAILLSYLKRIAEEFVSQEVSGVVLSVPVHFDYLQRRSMVLAAEIAGLIVLRIIAAPVCATIAYELDERKLGQDEQDVLIFDLGGHTLDVSLSRLDYHVVEVLAVSGNNDLGGNNFDDVLVDFFVKEFKRKKKADCTKSTRSMARLRVECQRAKRVLSSAMTASIQIDSLYDGIDFISSITRDKFTDLCMLDFRQCLEAVTKVLQDAKMSKLDIDEIVLVGGSTRIPCIQQIIKQYFNGKEPCKSINPYEAAAYGASFQAAILSGGGTGDAGYLLLLDVASSSLGIETAGGIMTKLVPRNKTVPCTANVTITTSVDNQPGVSIQVYEGEGQLTQVNTLLGKFNLIGIPPAPKGEPQIEITFDLDASCILSVTAKDKNNPTNLKQVHFDTQTTLSKQEIDQIRNNMKMYKAEEKEEEKAIQTNQKNKIEIEHNLKIISSALVVLISIEKYFGDYPDDKIKQLLNESEGKTDHEDIITNKNKNKLEDLYGAKADKENMLELFGNTFNFDIIYNKRDHCTRKDFDNIMNLANFCFRNYDQYKAVLFLFSGHGKKHDLIFSDYKNAYIYNGELHYNYQRIERDEIISHFGRRNFRDQVKKHKMYFLDCCRGIDHSKPIQVNNNNQQYAQVMGSDDESGSCHPDDNRCIFSSNTTGHQSYSYPETGGVLIEALYKILRDESNHNKNFLQLQTMIKRKVDNKKIMTKKKNKEVKAKMDFETTMYLDELPNIKFAVNEQTHDYDLIHDENERSSKRDINMKMYCNCEKCNNK